MLKKLIAIVIIVLSSLVFAGMAHGSDDYLLIKEQIEKTAQTELNEMGLTNEYVMVGSPIYSYSYDENVLREKSEVLLYPVFNADNEPVVWAVVLEFDKEKKVSFSSECIDIISSVSCRESSKIALVYSENQLYSWNGERLQKYGTFSGSSKSKNDINIQGLSALSEIKLQSVSLRHRVDINRAATRGESDYSAYVNPPIIKQPTNSGWCWAASMASIVNHEKGLHHSSISMANLYNAGFYDGANIGTVKSRLQVSFNIYTNLVNNNYLVHLLNSMGNGHPCYAQFTSNSGDHAVVIRGINFDAQTVSLMNPAPQYPASYYQGSIWNLYGNTGVVRYFSISSGEPYIMIAYLYI